MPFINLEPWACSEMVRYSIFPWSFGEGWQLTYSFCNQTSLVVMSFLILIKWKGMHMNLEPLKAGREAQWHPRNVHSHRITLHCAGTNQVFLYLSASLFAFCTWQRMNSCPGASSPPREPQMQLPGVAPGLATLKWIYSGRPVRADPKYWTPSPQSVNVLLSCHNGSVSSPARLFCPLPSAQIPHSFEYETQATSEAPFSGTWWKANGKYPPKFKWKLLQIEKTFLGYFPAGQFALLHLL